MRSGVFTGTQPGDSLRLEEKTVRPVGAGWEGKTLRLPTSRVARHQGTVLQSPGQQDGAKAVGSAGLEDMRPV